MAVWYCNYGDGSSTGYYAVAQWAALTVYGAGAIVRQLAAPAAGSERCFRTTAGGTSGAAEPTWTTTKGGSTTDATVTWVEVTGNSTYNWSAPFARLKTAVSSSWSAAGDTIYVASIHAETQTGSNVIVSAGTGASPQNIICVNASGTVPPVSADLRTTATVQSSNSTLEVDGSFYLYGISFTSNGATLGLSNTGTNVYQRWESATLKLNRNQAGDRISLGAWTTTSDLYRLNNVIFSFGNAGQGIYVGGAQVYWTGSGSSVSTTAVTALFQDGSGSGQVVIDGVDLSFLGSGKTLFSSQAATTSPNRRTASVINCKLGASVTIAATPANIWGGPTSLQISDSTSTQYRQELYAFEGTLTTETTFIRTGGASDGTTPISWKVVSTANSTWQDPFRTFQVAIWNSATGSSKTATIEIENGGTTLTNADVWIEVEYLGTSGFPIASTVSSGTADILASGSSIPTSSVSWAGGLGSAVKQYLQVTFTPQIVGYVRATVCVAKASQTLYIDPFVTIA